MSRAESYQIIDVPAEAETPESASRDAEERDGEREQASGGDHLALWSSSGGSNGSVARDSLILRRPTHTISLEHVPLPDALDERFVMLREPESARARGYRLLRHRLLSLDDPRVVAVTSAGPGEGKTTCAINLSLALAEDTMMRVLLVEANLRRPSLAGLLAFEPRESLVENVTRFTDVGPPYPVAAIGGTRLHVAALPASPLSEARLDRTLFAVALCDLRSAYDYIVIDAASVLESADADVIGECASGIVVATRAGVSRRAEVRRAIAQLAPARVLGTVLIDS